MATVAVDLFDHEANADTRDIIEARIEGARIVDGKIVDGKVINITRFDPRLRRTRDTGRFHAEAVALIGLGLVVLVMLLVN